VSVHVPGVGDVPVIWRPAVIGADAAYGRVAHPVIAWAHHRMVGTLPGTISTFTAGDRNRPVSTTFGIGFISGKLTIAQFVDLRDTAFGNGNYSSSGRWDDWGYPLSAINARTLNTEHEDGATAGRGIVKEAVKLASIALDILCMSGNVAAIRAAGIHATGDGGVRVIADLARIAPGPRTIIMHNDIAGSLKPYCWTRWLDDPGFPRDRFVAALRAAKGQPVPAPTPEAATVDSFAVQKNPAVCTVAAGSYLYVNSGLKPDPKNVQISTARKMPYLGFLPGPVRIVDYVDANGVVTGRAYFVHDPDVSNIVSVPAADVTAATLAGRRSEWDRQAARPKAIAESPLLPKP
jgi:hypothetical protein